MRVDIDELRRSYASLETSQLIHLREQGALRDDAAALLAAELDRRDVDATELDAIRAQLTLQREIRRQASPERRTAARLIDLVLVLVLLLVAAFVGRWIDGNDPPPLSALLAIGALLYWSLDAMFGGCTPGKRLLGVHVVCAHDAARRPARVALLKRNLLPALATLPAAMFVHWFDVPFGSPFGLAAFALIAVETNAMQSRGRWGDRWIGAVVVDRKHRAQ